MNTLKILSRHLSGQSEKKCDNSESLFRYHFWDLIPEPINTKESLRSRLQCCVLVSVTSFGIFGEGYVANHGLEFQVSVCKLTGLICKSASFINCIRPIGRNEASQRQNKI